jgi:hypothetical protein
MLAGVNLDNNLYNMFDVLTEFGEVLANCGLFALRIVCVNDFA